MGHIWLHYQYPIQKIIFSNQKLNLKYNLIFNKPIYEGYTYNIILGRGSNLVVMDSYYYDFILFVKLFKQNVTKDKTTWGFNNTKEFWLDNGWKGILANDVILKFTLDILLSHKINFQPNWIRIYECLPKHYTCKMSFDHYYTIVYIIWIIEIK